MKLRHITSINDLSCEEIEAIFSFADRCLESLGDPITPFRIGTSTNECAGSIMATLFHEPSTRTRLSFESAMLRLGGNVISSADPAASSAAKGETLADTIRIVSGYADVIVLRHPHDGAARFAAEYASVPVINGGDGAHEHPTQTLCDLYTMRREKGRIEGLNVVLLGDLRGSRTVHSLIYALARFGANILLQPAKEMDLPAHVDWRLRNEFQYAPTDVAKFGRMVTFGYRRREEAEQPVRDEIDALYVTRFQKERWADEAKSYPVVDAKFMNTPPLKNALVLHPLPRVNELDPALDSDTRAAYFRQASYGVPIRMGLISLLLTPGSSVSPTEAGSRLHSEHGELLREIEHSCANENCITRIERQAIPAFWLIPDTRQRLRCLYCEHDFCDT